MHKKFFRTFLVVGCLVSITDLTHASSTPKWFEDLNRGKFSTVFPPATVFTKPPDMLVNEPFQKMLDAERAAENQRRISICRAVANAKVLRSQTYHTARIKLPGTV